MVTKPRIWPANFSNLAVASTGEVGMIPGPVIGTVRSARSLFWAIDGGVENIYAGKAGNETG